MGNEVRPERSEERKEKKGKNVGCREENIQTLLTHASSHFLISIHWKWVDKTNLATNGSTVDFPYRIHFPSSSLKLRKIYLETFFCSSYCVSCLVGLPPFNSPPWRLIRKSPSEVVSKPLLFSLYWRFKKWEIVLRVSASDDAELEG